MKKVIINCLFFLITIISFSACSNFIEDIANTEQKLQPSDCTVAYTVEHYLQSEDRASFNIVTSDTIQLQGKPESLTQAVANTYKGFSPQEIEQLPIKSDGSTIIKIYYYRLDSIIYDLAGGTNSSENPDYYDDDNLPIQLKAPTKDGFIFFAWINEDQDIISEITTRLTKPIQLKALWYKEGEAYYLVKHNLQGLEDLSTYTFKEKEYLVGNANTQTSLTGKNYTGFTNQTIQQQVINSDHSTVVNINYDRNTYTVHFVVTYDDRKDVSDVQVSGRYQEEFVIPEDQFNNDYNIDKIEPSVSNIFEENKYYTVSLKSKYEYIHINDGASTIYIPIVIRDFRGYTETGYGDGYINDEIIAKFGPEFISVRGHGHPDFEPKKNDGKLVKNMVENTLDPDGLPVFKQSPSGTTENSFYMWYRDIPGINKTFCKTLQLNKKNQNPITYEYNSQSFYPLGIDEGFGKTPPYKVNGGFTDVINFYVLYNGDGRIDISGDDDIWVFINGILAIDLGGCHATEQASVNIKDSTITKEINGKSYSYKHNQEFDISEGQVVKVKIFHAERCASGSSLKLNVSNLEIVEKNLK